MLISFPCNMFWAHYKMLIKQNKSHKFIYTGKLVSYNTFVFFNDKMPCQGKYRWYNANSR